VDHPELLITELGTVAPDLGTVSAEESVNLLQPSVIFVIFIIGLVCRLVYIAKSYRQLCRMIKDSEQHSLEDGVTLAVVDLPVAPFSWMHTIVLSRIDYEECNPSILAHERGHIRQHHSWDIVFVEVLTALQWFNPVVWLLRRDLRTIHEYEADASVLSSGSDVSQYIQLLMRKAMGTKACILANGINNSTIKKRINMMLLNKSPRRNALKLLALLPIVGITLALNAETVTDFVYKNDEPQKQVPVKKGKKNATIKTGSNQDINVIEILEPKSNDELKVYDTTLGENEPNAAVLILNTKKKGEEPLLIVDDKIATIEQVRALPRDAVARIATMREKNAIKSFGEIGKNGALIITTVKHQKEIDNEPILPDVFDEVDEMPQFPGGMAGMMQYLSSNLRYPQDAREAGTQGRVIVSFIVEKDGSISNAKVAKPTYSSLDEEALRVVSAMPKWTPGKQNGEAVRVKYSVPVSFRLGNKETSNVKGTATPAESAEGMTGIDENGRLIVNGKEVKRYLFEPPIDNQLSRIIANIMLNDAEHFDYEIDGVPVSVKDLKEKNSPQNPIKSIEYVQKDSEHPKDRLLITTKKAE
ncbi:MAG: M56 family metallopeptidase, partial [Prevotella sp.]|nr:M56 family metallopeptidase [Prevotella sp.]